MYMTGFCLNQMPLGNTIEGKSNCYGRRKPGHLLGRSLVYNIFILQHFYALFQGVVIHFVWTVVLKHRRCRDGSLVVLIDGIFLRN